MSQAGRKFNGVVPPGAGIQYVETDDNNQAGPDGGGVVYFLPRPPDPLRVPNIVTTGDNNHTFFAAVTDSIFLPDTTADASQGVFGIASVPMLHARGAAGTGSLNLGVGGFALNLNLTTAINDTAFGALALGAITSGSNNLAAGTYALQSATTASRNTILGSLAMSIPGFPANFTGDNNISVGYSSSNFMDATAHDNIVIGSVGGPGINNTIIIGSPAPTQAACFIHGIRGVPLAGYEQVVIDANGQLGSAAIPVAGVQSFALPVGGPVVPTGGGLITLRNGPNISIDSLAAHEIRVNVTPRIDLPDTNAAGTEGIYAISGVPVLHTIGGVADRNLGVGSNALSLNTTGLDLTAVGSMALRSNTTGLSNCAIGARSMTSNLGGTSCVAIGADSLINNVGGYENISIGAVSSTLMSPNAFRNIVIGSQGGPGINNTIIIGTVATQTACFIHGIRGVAVANRQQVVIDPNGKLGSAPENGSYGFLATLDADTANIFAPNVVYNLGNGIQGMNIRYNPDAAYSPGNAFVPAYFQAPVAGLYSFTFNLVLVGVTDTNAHSDISLTSLAPGTQSAVATWYSRKAGIGDRNSYSFTQQIVMAANGRIFPSFINYSADPLIGAGIYTSFSGYLVHT